MPGVQRATYWELDIDSQGRVIREDVKQAARTMWKAMCSRARAVLGDDLEAPEIVERCLGRVSRYLDTRGAAPFTQNVNALLFVSFRRELWSVRSRRKVPVDISTCANHLRDSSWSERIESQLDIQNLIRNLSERNRTILYLRRAGYAWKEVSALLCATVPELKSSFWRELVRLRSEVATSRQRNYICRLTAKTDPNGKSVPNGEGRPLMNTV